MKTRTVEKTLKSADDAKNVRKDKLTNRRSEKNRERLLKLYLNEGLRSWMKADVSLTNG
ncbi:hypothetical protein PPTG_23705 [Phytophthora nicotianae INRA-310]|uniref:Uncharacterized protein n=1 Tax=Phytophthora nicotianae (strain INRA-310) TaxID=761204 RepID=W2PSD9_PHYN3|nr:hypothetical protein PPTG_23705 [Phytophthora nicotianae INRA-310]ETN03858.1 hypothetical protein PPTG_23705 [Phytophthora nicotianae INRA-310]